MTAVNLNRAIRGPVTAVPVVAGKGVRIVPDVENNRFVVEAEEYSAGNGINIDSDGVISVSVPTVIITDESQAVDNGVLYVVVASNP